MNKTLLSLLLVMGVVGILPDQAESAQMARVLELNGSAEMVRSKKATALKVGDFLSHQDSIKVAEGSSLFLGWGKDVVTLLGPGSEATLKQVRKLDYELEMTKGVTASAVRNPSKRKNHYQLRTKNAVMGVRGTVFYTEAPVEGPVFMCTCKGHVAVETLKGEVVDEIRATHHDRPITLKKDSKGNWATETAPMGDRHSDLDVETLEKKLAQLASEKN